MTYEEAINLKHYKHYCACGGYAGMSERAKSDDPHMIWCPQYPEWLERSRALKDGPKTAP